MNDRNNNGGIPLFGGQQPNVPIVGQPEQPIIAGFQCIITPQMKEKVEGWVARTGLGHGEVAMTIMRLGICAFSMMIDKEEDHITNPEHYFPPNQNA